MVYEVETWGQERSGPYAWHRSGAGGWALTERRSRYARIRPGGRVYLHPSRFKFAEKLAEAYDVEVLIGKPYTHRKWYAEILKAEKVRG